MNYDIYNKELTVLDRKLKTWQHLLLGNCTTIYMDHANLMFYHQPQKLSPWAKQAVTRIMQYDILIKHKLGLFDKANALLYWPDYPQGTLKKEIAFPPSLFIGELTTKDTHSVIESAQHQHKDTLQKLPYLKLHNNLYYYKSQLIVLEDNKLRWGVLSLYHNSTTTGHPGIRRTLHAITKDYWWPSLKINVIDYIKGCAICQSNKLRTNQPKTPTRPIHLENSNLPFRTIAMDFITKLPQSQGYDTILTITDHNCSKVALLFPCKETISAEEVAVLYATHVFPHYRIPQKIITDRDPRFTSFFSWMLLNQLGIMKNMSIAYHPQTDGQSEQIN